MNDSDPRPMPTQVLAAYKDRLNLKELLESDVFTDRSRIAVFDELVERLIEEHGSVEVSVGKRTRTLPIRDRMKDLGTRFDERLETPMGIEDYGGGDRVMLKLAQAMQPRWFSWWDSFDPKSDRNVISFVQTCMHVLGQRQFAWIAAQYGRYVLRFVAPEDLDFSERCIDAAERWAIDPSEGNKKEAVRARNETDAWSDYEIPYSRRIIEGYWPQMFSAPARVVAVEAMTYPYFVSDAAAGLVYAFQKNASPVLYPSPQAALSGAYKTLADLTKRLITPTLITNASRGLR